jgi:hypothetical protein
VESSCELGNEPSGSIKCWELPNGCTTCGLSSDTQRHRVSELVSIHCSLKIFNGWNGINKLKYHSCLGSVSPGNLSRCEGVRNCCLTNNKFAFQWDPFLLTY